MSDPSRSESAFPVLVVGAGFAGVGAAWAAAKAGARVVVIHGAAGASALYSGVVDGDASDDRTSELASAMDLIVQATPRAVATREGVVRASLGRDSRVLDLELLAGKRVGVVDLGRDDWDAELVALSLQSSAWAERTRTQFLSVRVAGLQTGAERRITSYDLARAFESESRRESLATALLSSEPAVDGWLSGAWLGIETDVAGALAARIGRPIGEVSSAPGGAAGARFEHRRRALLEALGVEVHLTRARQVRPSSRMLRDGTPALEVELENSVQMTARAVVLAVGGVAAGGITLAPLGHARNSAWQLSIDAPITFELDGEIYDTTSSLNGMSFQRLGIGALERIGIRVDSTVQVAAGLSLYGAGDVLTGRPRTVLSALSTGIIAGQRAAHGTELA